MIAVVGLGYVGLPLACLLSQKFEVLGFDKDHEKIKLIASHRDPAGELDETELRQAKFSLSSDPHDLALCRVIIVCVPTPVLANNKPNFEPLLTVSETIGRYMRKNTIIVYESTVYPGVTESLCASALMKYHPHLKRSHFKLGYSPERVNPGDKKNKIENITKLVAAEDQATLKTLLDLYGSICPVYPCPSIKVAEATKLYENVQRDVNIAFANEFMQICHASNLDMNDVLKAAATKWNALSFHPGMVGGDCIYADPYYALEWRSQKNLAAPSVVANARDINYRMPDYYADVVKSKLEKDTKTILVLGKAFKKNVSDCRNSGALRLCKRLSEDFSVQVFDPLIDNISDWSKITPVDAIVIAVKHDILATLDLSQKVRDGLIIDLENI